MFGIRYEVKCPFCGETYEADHGITNYYKIKGKEHLGEYVEEHHWGCGNSFFRLCIDKDIYKLKTDGLTLEQAIEKTIEQIIAKYSYADKQTVTSEEYNRIKNECTHIYENVTEADIYVANVKDEDLIYSTTICW